jgi:ATP-dependent DNA helicase RecG
MKTETHNIEFKRTWKDEYLEWICGYANAAGGVLYIGRDDDGTAVGVAKAKSLMEAIPCKITDTMGIIADVNLRRESGKDVIEIKVDKYPSLISYHGKYFYRSGTTMRTISGKELDRLILKQQGMTWDAVPLPRLKVKDLDPAAVKYFKDEAVRRGRLTRGEINVSREILLDNLHLLNDDGALTRAAMLAFHRDPEKWVTGAYVKIGYFENSDSDLRYQDEVHGPLILQADKVVDLVYTKYLKALITYEGIHRVEQYMFHKDAFREIVLNAIVHKDYSGCNPIQISVYPDKIYIWNDGEFPPELNTAAKLFGKHSSKPYNPGLAGVFFKAGLIEAWGRGFDKIIAGCKEYGGQRPNYKISESGVMVLCKACPKYVELQNSGAGTLEETGRKKRVDGLMKTTPETTPETTTETAQEKIRDSLCRIIAVIKSRPDATMTEIAAETGLSRDGVKWNLSKLKELKKIRRIGYTKGGHWEVL